MSIAADITEKRRREEDLRRALDEKKVLLREVHHRVKNNLQVIISLLNMKEELVRNAADREIFFGVLGRVEAMALIHDKLYQGEGLEQIDFDTYLQELCGNLALEYGTRSRRIRLDYRGEKVVLGIDRAIPLGLLVNELITNALKHAFPNGKGGTVSVRLAERDRQLYLEVADDGVGLPEEMFGGSNDPERTGINLAYLFAGQVGGRLELHGNGGTEAMVYCAIEERER
jgi:two-component sensor histidine kinase